MPVVAGLVSMHSRFARESLTSCKEVQGLALVLVHIYGFVQYIYVTQ